MAGSVKGDETNLIDDLCVKDINSEINSLKEIPTVEEKFICDICESCLSEQQDAAFSMRDVNKLGVALYAAYKLEGAQLLAGRAIKNNIIWNSVVQDVFHK
ncbi:hypothetical protein HNY73_018745 [Argiope bruennichi]|uniref:Uncharacterized protein n=1 Tax=Argiope bruennichi TaxID=94029 RepID=A0A8T0EF24_ARGBR|nr:hypothetical protein HNY73_018745 [Argiope bruennichi]